MAKGLCCDCGKHRNLYRPVIRLTDGTVLWACGGCWTRYEYAQFLVGEGRA